uniref:Uncharacterized protein n=1 Tax=Anguilla anguilla TaxID=7936 RepID=A0A0E9VA01_ANGAN
MTDPDTWGIFCDLMRLMLSSLV